MTTVRIDRVLPGPPDQVWHALTRPDALAARFWPEQSAPPWRWDGDDAESLVTIDLVNLGAVTELSLPHELLADMPTSESHAQGRSDCLDRLPSWLTAGASG